MFKIEYKIIYENCSISEAYHEIYPEIVDYFDAVDAVYGDILITVNNSQYGGISDIPTKMDYDDTYGDTVLDVWFEKLIEACMELYGGTECRIEEPDCSDVFLCFNKNKNGGLSVSYLSGDKTIWTETISYTEFVKEVICKAQRFIDDLCEYTERIAYAPLVSWLTDKLEELKKDM